MSSTVAVVLAGGNGKRMDILCHVRPKPALPFAGRFKVIDFSLSNCIYSQITNIAVLTDYQRSYMADYLSQWRLMNANSINFRLLPPSGAIAKSCRILGLQISSPMWLHLARSSQGAQ